MSQKNCYMCKNWEAANKLGFPNSEGLGLCYFINKIEKKQGDEIDTKSVKVGFTVSIIQNNLSDNEFIFWEGWVDECWKGLYLKPEYKGLTKTDSIEKVIRDRFPRIGQEFGFKIKEYDYFKHKGKFIMKVVFYK